MLQHDNHCIKICEIQRYTALSNTVKCLCNAPYFSVSRLVRTLFLKQSGYGEKWSVTWMFYRVRQCSISPYFKYLYAVNLFDYLAQANKAILNFPNVFVNVISTHYKGDFNQHFDNLNMHNSLKNVIFEILILWDLTFTSAKISALKITHHMVVYM